MITLILALVLCVSHTSGEDVGDSLSYIVNGEAASSGEFPHVGVMKYRGYFRCGGSLIAPSTVLTAAHCVTDYLPGGRYYPPNWDELTVNFGSVNLSSDEVAIPVESVHAHEDYAPKSSYIHDIAIVKLKKPVTLTNSIQTVKLPSPRFEVPAGSLVSVSGFGMYEPGNPGIHQVSSYKRKFQTKVVDDAKCRMYWFPSNIRESQMCTETRANAYGVCSGDSGSGVIFNGEVVGVVSFIHSACATGYPDVETKVSHHLDFIERHLR